jgi:hypothetical protein
LIEKVIDLVSKCLFKLVYALSCMHACCNAPCRQEGQRGAGAGYRTATHRGLTTGPTRRRDNATYHFANHETRGRLIFSVPKFDWRHVFHQRWRRRRAETRRRIVVHGRKRVLYHGWRLSFGSKNPSGRSVPGWPHLKTLAYVDMQYCREGRIRTETIEMLEKGNGN